MVLQAGTKRISRQHECLCRNTAVHGFVPLCYKFAFSEGKRGCKRDLGLGSIAALLEIHAGIIVYWGKPHPEILLEASLRQCWVYS